MKSLSFSLLAAALATGLASAQTAYTTPVGYVSQTCKANSDTIVGVPLRQSSVGAGALSVNPDTSTIPGSAILTLSGTPGFTVNAFANTHYAKFKDGPAAGQWFVITANTASSLTVNLNGATLSAVSTNALAVLKFWTLAELINPATATTDPLTTPNAIVASLSTALGGRRTEVLIPSLSGVGTNLAPTVAYFIHGGIWKKAGAGNTDFGTDQLWPDSYVIIRNPAAVTADTKYTIAGEVEPNEFDYPLATQSAIKQDNYISLIRPIDVSLNGLGLANTTAFLASTSTALGGRRDELLVFDNAAAARNKAPSASYFVHAGIWKKAGGGNTDFGTDVIPAGQGFIIRKYQSGTGETFNWNNTPTY